MFRRIKILCLIFILLSIISLVNCKGSHSQVLVIGTIHQRHNTNENYSYSHVLQILENFHPDVICVEIRPQDFRKTLYLKEMTLATIYGLEHDKKVYPIDWWNETNYRQERSQYMETAEYAEKKKEEDKRTAESSIIQSFKKKYGEWKEFSKSQGYSFFNGKEYNDYITRGYDISMSIYGDHSMNGYWQTRNQNMLNLIRKAIDENRGKRVIILTGAEHKYYFDKYLAEMRDMDLIEFSSLLPLKPRTKDEGLTIYYAKGLARQFFDVTTEEEIDSAYRLVMVPFVHGPNMDFKPETIPQENIEAAKILLDEWRKKHTNSILLNYELGWYHFLTSSYEKAIEYYKEVIPVMDKIVDERYRNFVKESIYRNLGLCYDLLGNREKAVESYIRGEQLFKQVGRPEWIGKALYSDYKHKPYKKAKKENKN